MKNNHISNLSKWAMIVAALILQISCQQDDSFHPTEDSTIINLSVSAANTGTAMDNGESASAIKSLCILQFNANGTTFGTLRHVGIGTETTPNSGKYSATLLQSVDNNDKYKLVILANFPDGDYGIFYRMGGRGYAEVQQACLSAELTGESNVLEFTAQHPFPMFGIAKDGDPQFIDENMDLGTVSLVRAVARVDIGIGSKNADNNTWKKSGVPFAMTQVQIWKDGKQYAYMPVENNFSSSEGILTINSPSPVGDTEIKKYDERYITSGTYCSEKIYLPEANLQWGSVFDDNHTNRLAIIVGGYYKNSAALTYYRVDFTNDISGDKMNILRNHVYQFTITKIEDQGYTTAELAYNSKPENMGFEVEIEVWDTSKTASVPSLIGYNISYGRVNGENVQWTPSDKIPVKRDYWGGNQYKPFNYNEFYGEANSFYAERFPIGVQNGRLYSSVADAFSYEGAYPNLMVAGDDATGATDGDRIAWKTDGKLTAFDVCRSYREGGYNDWRLPRLSELALIYLNQESLKKMRGFTPLTEVYWSGSEYQVSTSDQDRKHSEQVWIIDFGNTSPNATNSVKSDTKKIRCVRQSD